VLYTPVDKVLYTPVDKVLYTHVDKVLYTTVDKVLYTPVDKVLYTPDDKVCHMVSTKCGTHWFTPYDTRLSSQCDTQDKAWYTPVTPVNGKLGNRKIWQR